MGLFRGRGRDLGLGKPAAAAGVQGEWQVEAQILDQGVGQICITRLEPLAAGLMRRPERDKSVTGLSSSDANHGKQGFRSHHPKYTIKPRSTSISRSSSTSTLRPMSSLM